MICPNCQCGMRHTDDQMWLKCVCGYQIYAKEFITKDEILMGREVDNPLTSEMEENLKKLIYAINMFRALYNRPMKVTSGYRPIALNLAVGGAKASNHTLCLAIDISDVDGQLREFTLKHLDALKRLGLYCEDFRWTKGWIHYQCVPPKSGKRIFIPNTNPATDPECWDGEYDSKYDD